MNNQTEVNNESRAEGQSRLNAGLEPDPPFKGHWHHGNGILVCGGIRIAREDFDTQPCESVRAGVFDWICKTLNDKQGF